MNITLRQIEIFLLTAKSGSLSRAAAELFLTQAAASMALKEFETQLGEKVFDRVGKRLVLNESGRAAIPIAAEIIDRTAELGACFAGREGVFGRLVIGASSTIGNYILPEHVAGFIQAHPRAEIQLEVGNTEEIIRKVLQFKVDIGCIEGSCYEPELDVVPWMDDELAVFSSVRHPLAAIDLLGRRELEAGNWILREKGSGTREIFAAQIKERRLKIRVFLELGHTEAIKNAVSRGSGISCLSRHALRDLLSLGAIKLFQVPFLDLRRQFAFVIHRRKYRTMILESFLHYAVAAGKKGKENDRGLRQPRLPGAAAPGGRETGEKKAGR